MQTKLSRRALLQGLIVGGALTLAGLAALPNLRKQTFTFGISRYRRPLPGLTKPLRLVQLSDLHYGPYIGADLVKAWVQAAMAQQPDLIVLTGDIIDAGSGRFPLDYSKQNPSASDPLLQALAGLKAPLGVYGVWGNHDLALPAEHRLSEQDLAQAGIQMLVNQGRYIRPDFYLAGVDDVWLGNPDLELAMSSQRRGGAALLLAHEPDILPFVPSDINLTLCGHTHGGQIVLPLVGAPWTPALNDNGQRFREGWFSQPANALVCRGLGVTGIPLRFNAPAELVVLDLHPS